MDGEASRESSGSGVSCDAEIRTPTIAPAMTRRSSGSDGASGRWASASAIMPINRTYSVYTRPACFGYLVHQPFPGHGLLAFGRRQAAEHLRDGVSVCGDDRQFGRRLGERVHDQADVAVEISTASLTPKVAVEGSRRNVGRRGDLIDRGFGVALLGEQVRRPRGGLPTGSGSSCVPADWLSYQVPTLLLSPTCLLSCVRTQPTSVLTAPDMCSATVAAARVSSPDSMASTMSWCRLAFMFLMARSTRRT